jgi:RNA polymerase subunit RPABC4/transcription elongation factor Spt4
MAFFENLGKNIAGAAQAAAKKSSEIVGVTKLNMNINSEEDKIKALTVEIGKLVVEKFKAGETLAPELAEKCTVISEIEETIKGLREKIREVKNIRICESCGAELERTITFCPKCGAKQPEIVPVAPEAPKGIPCPSCGAILPEGTKFCQNCGSKV